VRARDDSLNGTFLNGERMIRGEAVVLKEGDVLSPVVILRKPPQVIPAKEREKLVVALVFHRDADEARASARDAAAAAAAAASKSTPKPAQSRAPAAASSTPIVPAAAANAKHDGRGVGGHALETAMLQATWPTCSWAQRR